MCRLAHEVYGEMLLQGGFTLHAKADRIDRLDGGLAIIDYKTGGIEQNRAGARLLGAAPARSRHCPRRRLQECSGFEVKQLAFWHITGKDEAGDVVEFGKSANPTQLADEALGEASINCSRGLETQPCPISPNPMAI